jgi:hypothetical protein
MPRLTYKRLPDETARAYEAFVIYCELGPQRTTEEVSKRLQKSSPYIRQWSKKYQWVERAPLYDDAMTEAKQRARLKVVEQETARWERRRLKSRKREYRLALDLESLARNMLKRYTIEEKEEERIYLDCPVHGDECPGPEAADNRCDQYKTVSITVTHLPVKYTVRDVTAVIDCLTKLRRTALDMPTSNINVTGSVALTVEQQKEQDLKNARAAFEQLMADMDSAIDRMLQRSPELQREQLQKELPGVWAAWCAEDFNVEPKQLVAGVDVPEGVGEVIEVVAESVAAD